MPDAIDDLFRRFGKAFNKADVDEIAACVTEDFEWRLNAGGSPAVRVLTAMDALLREEALRIVVVKGNGRHFQAGADLAWISGVAAQSPRENESVSRQTAEAIRRLDTCPVPTLALVQGGCFGGGTGIAAAC